MIHIYIIFALVKIMRSTEEMKTFLPVEYAPFADCLALLEKAYNAVAGDFLHTGYQAAISAFVQKWYFLHENFNLSIPNKVN